MIKKVKFIILSVLTIIVSVKIVYSSNSEPEVLKSDIYERTLPYNRSSGVYYNNNSTGQVIRVSKDTPEIVQELNNEVYKVTAEYFNSNMCSNIPADYIDPLMIMAMCNVESGVWNDFNILYTAALPLRVMDTVSVSDIREYGLEEIMQTKEYFKIALPYYKHQGPLQIGINYGVYQAVNKSNLRGNENIYNLSSIYPSINKSEFMTTQPNAGDRFNYADSVNRSAGVFNEYFKRYHSKVLINSKYMAMVLMSMAHNTGMSVLANRDFEVSQFWGTFYECREYAKALAREDVLQLIKSEALKVKVPIPSRATKAFCDEVILYLKDKQYIKLNHPFKGSIEHRNYPIHVLYEYFILQKLYT